MTSDKLRNVNRLAYSERTRRKGPPCENISLLVQTLLEDNKHRYALMTLYKCLSNLYLTKVRRRRQRGLGKHTREL